MKRELKRNPVWRRRRKAEIIGEIIMEAGVIIACVGLYLYFWLAPWGA